MCIEPWARERFWKILKIEPLFRQKPNSKQIGLVFLQENCSNGFNKVLVRRSPQRYLQCGLNHILRNILVLRLYRICKNFVMLLLLSHIGYRYPILPYIKVVIKNSLRSQWKYTFCRQCDFAFGVFNNSLCVLWCLHVVT